MRSRADVLDDGRTGAGALVRARAPPGADDLPTVVVRRRRRSLLVGAVLAAVHHAEVVAHRVGEPFGSLVLAVAVTVIEVALIVTLMISGGEGTATLARDTVFAAVMITVNGIVGPRAGGRRAQAPPRPLQPRGHGLGAGHRRRARRRRRWCCRGSPPASPGRSSPPASSPSRRSPRSRSTACSSSPRPCGTATSSCRWTVRTSPDPHDDDGDGHADPPTTRDGARRASDCCWSPWSAVVGLAKVASPVDRGRRRAPSASRTRSSAS